MKDEPISGDLVPFGGTGGYVDQTPTVEITGAKEALVVGPNDRLVMIMDPSFDVATIEWFRDQVRAAGLGPNQVVFVAGVDRIIKLEGGAS